MAMAKRAIFLKGILESLILVLMGAVLGWAGCRSSGAIPKGVYAAPARVDLGTVDLTKTNEISGDFAIVNSTNRDITIVDCEVSCGCSRVALSGKRVAPQSFVTVRLTADLSGSQLGERVFRAFLVTDSKSVPVIPVELKCYVVTDEVPGVIPIELGNLGPGQEIERSYTVLRRPATAVHIAAVHGEDELRNCLAISTMSVSDTIAITVRGVAPQRVGPFTIVVDLTAEGASWRTAQVELNGIVEPDLRVSPVVYVGLIEPGDISEQEVPLIARAELRPKIVIERVSLKDPEPLLLVSVAKAGPMNPTLRFTLRHSGSPGTFAKAVTIIVLSNNGQRYELNTEVRGRFL